MKNKILPLLGLALALASCQRVETSKTIYTSFYPIYEFTKRIVGDKYEVVNITPVGAEPHDFEPSAKDVAGFSSGAALFLNGLGMEHWTDKLPKEVADKAHVVTGGIEVQKINGVNDPHVWLSIPNAIKEMGNILSVMKGLDPANASYFQTNYEAAAKEFASLDQEYRPLLQQRKNKYLAVSHAAFGYLCKEYSLEQLYVSGLTPDDEPTAKDMEGLVKQVKDHNITTIFFEELASPAISKKIAEETGAKTDTLNPLEGLTKEELKSENYITVMKDNFKKILEADNR